jgi:hypothetical protein
MEVVHGKDLKTYGSKAMKRKIKISLSRIPKFLSTYSSEFPKPVRSAWARKNCQIWPSWHTERNIMESTQSREPRGYIICIYTHHRYDDWKCCKAFGETNIETICIKDSACYRAKEVDKTKLHSSNERYRRRSIIFQLMVCIIRLEDTLTHQGIYVIEEYFNK